MAKSSLKRSSLKKTWPTHGRCDTTGRIVAVTAFVLTVGAVGCRSSQPPVRIVGVESSAFDPLPEPTLAGRPRLHFWATHYSVHVARDVAPRGHPLLNPQGKPLGPKLERRDWCDAAMQGTVRVLRRAGVEGYQFLRLGEGEEVDCTRRYPKHKAIGRSRFRRMRHAFPKGAWGARLVPYRSVAVSRGEVPHGTVLYIPDAKGVEVAFPDGQHWTHDGYFLVADTGGGLKSGHIDLFLGDAQKNPFAFVKSTPKARFATYVIDDPDIVASLHRAHEMPPPKLHAEASKFDGPKKRTKPKLSHLLVASPRPSRRHARRPWVL
ncbi:MAG: hypothetical protein IPK13_12255 [Deltaproteobacteria bacterium]|nr:hypothetical protein [Deltaproteobacteria bacterium]